MKATGKREKQEEGTENEEEVLLLADKHVYVKIVDKAKKKWKRLAFVTIGLTLVAGLGTTITMAILACLGHFQHWNVLVPDYGANPSASKYDWQNNSTTMMFVPRLGPELGNGVKPEKIHYNFARSIDGCGLPFNPVTGKLKNLAEFQDWFTRASLDQRKLIRDWCERRYESAFFGGHSHAHPTDTDDVLHPHGSIEADETAALMRQALINSCVEYKEANLIPETYVSASLLTDEDKVLFHSSKGLQDDTCGMLLGGDSNMVRDATPRDAETPTRYQCRKTCQTTKEDIEEIGSKEAAALMDTSTYTSGLKTTTHDYSKKGKKNKLEAFVDTHRKRIKRQFESHGACGTEFSYLRTDAKRVSGEMPSVYNKSFFFSHENAESYGMKSHLAIMGIWKKKLRGFGLSRVSEEDGFLSKRKTWPGKPLFSKKDTMYTLRPDMPGEAHKLCPSCFKNSQSEVLEAIIRKRKELRKGKEPLRYHNEVILAARLGNVGGFFSNNKYKACQLRESFYQQFGGEYLKAYTVHVHQGTVNWTRKISRFRDISPLCKDLVGGEAR